jgi:hypothetical protein
MKSLTRFVFVVGVCLLVGLVVSRTAWMAANASPQGLGPGSSADAKKDEAAKQETPKPADQPIVVWEKPGNDKPTWLTREGGDEMTRKLEEAIRDRLQQRMDIDLNQQPLSNFIKIISDEIKVPIWLDQRALEEENVSPDEPITLEFSNAKCCNIMKFVLSPLELTYCIDRETVVITTIRASPNTARYYDMSYVLPDNSLTNELIQLIETTVTPDQWSTVGGTSTMQMFGSILVASAPESTHFEIESVIRNVAKQPTNNMKPRRPLPQLNKGPGMGGMMSIRDRAHQ